MAVGSRLPISEKSDRTWSKEREICDWTNLVACESKLANSLFASSPTRTTKAKNIIDPHKKNRRFLGGRLKFTGIIVQQLFRPGETFPQNAGSYGTGFREDHQLAGGANGQYLKSNPF